MPYDTTFKDPPATIAAFRHQLEGARRDPATVSISMVVFDDPIPEKLERQRDIGIARVTVGPGRSHWDEADQTLPHLDRYAALLPRLA